MSKKDPYVEFAPVYDRWQSLFSKPFSVAMVLRVQQALREWDIPERSLIDLACGTGSLAWHWKHRFPAWTVWGVDGSASMIERARVAGPDDSKKSRAKQATTARRLRGSTTAETERHPTFLAQNLTSLRLDRTFGLATCFFDSLNHITRVGDLAKVFVSAHSVLKDGGLFIFDILDEDSFVDTFSMPSITQDDDLFVGMETLCEKRRGTQFGLARFTFFVRSGKDWRRTELEIVERCWHREEIDPLLIRAGFEIIHVQLIDPEDQPDVFVPRRLYVCRR